MLTARSQSVILNFKFLIMRPSYYLQSAALPTLILLLTRLTIGAEPITLQRGGVILRNGPGNYYPMQSVLEAGCKLTVGERKSGWARVEIAGDGAGWVAESALSAEAAGGVKAGTEIKGPGAASQVRVASLTAMIKGLAANTGTPLDPNRTLQPADGLPADSALAFRRSFAPEDADPPIPAQEAGLQMMPQIVAASPVIARMIADEWGGEMPSKSRYASQLLLWIAERAGAGALSPNCIITREGSGAVSLPGGWTVVGSELIRSLTDEAELAGILGHELCHVVFNHGRRAFEKEAWRVGADETFAELDAEAGGEEMAELEAFAESVREQARRRWTLNDELQADSAATVWLARCGYDCTGLQRALEAMRAAMGQGLIGHEGMTIAWLNSRDELDKRIDKLAKQTARLKRKYKGGGTFVERFVSQFGN